MNSNWLKKSAPYPYKKSKTHGCALDLAETFLTLKGVSNEY